MPTSSPSLLLVEDDDAFRSLLQQWLSPFMQVLPAACAEEGLEILTGRFVEGLLCDISMPGMGAAGLLAHLSSFHRERLVLMTASPGHVLLRHPDVVGQIPALTKPFSFPALRGVLWPRLGLVGGPLSLPATI